MSRTRHPSHLRSLPDSPRPDWDATWMQVAEVVALRSRCTRAQYGSVIVDSENRIVASGYNGPASGFPTIGGEFCSAWCHRSQNGPGEQPLSYADCPAVHSEANCLLQCSRTARIGGTMYVSGIPCIDCAKLIANSGLARVVYKNETGLPHRSPTTALQHIRTCGISVVSHV